MAAKSRRKGKAGEREAAKAVAQALGCEARRGVQFSGSPDSPDIKTSIPYVHFEVKRCEKLDLYAAMDQARRDAKASIPVVLHRKNRRPWLVVCLLEDLEFLADTIHASMSCISAHGEAISDGLARASESAGVSEADRIAAEAGRTRSERSE